MLLIHNYVFWFLRIFLWTWWFKANHFFLWMKIALSQKEMLICSCHYVNNCSTKKSALSFNSEEVLIKLTNMRFHIKPTKINQRILAIIRNQNGFFVSFLINNELKKRLIYIYIYILQTVWKVMHLSIINAIGHFKF